MEIFARNVNDALRQGAALFIDHTKQALVVSPRGKMTLEWPEPVITHYENPRERVLFSQARDCNPFLHFFESLWLIAGRRDLKFMETLAPRFVNYSDGDGILQGSYGYRWRTSFEYDQLDFIIDLLAKDPETRRAVLTMWSPWDLNVGIFSKDIPCNTNVYFKIRNKALRMTVVNRSNDMIWGAYGANAVHFSMLQEYIAGKLGIGVGLYTQVSDSFHVYLHGKEGEAWERVSASYLAGSLAGPCPYRAGAVCPLGMASGHSEWDTDMRRFFQMFDDDGVALIPGGTFNVSWWEYVVRPMWNTFVSHKTKDPVAECGYAKLIEAPDWRLAVIEWLDRRSK